MSTFHHPLTLPHAAEKKSLVLGDVEDYLDDEVQLVDGDACAIMYIAAGGAYGAGGGSIASRC